VAAAENDEVVSIGDDVRTECFTPTAETPMLQEPIHVDDGEQRTGHTALWRAALVALPATHAPFPVAIPFLVLSIADDGTKTCAFGAAISARIICADTLSSWDNFFIYAFSFSDLSLRS
jgi:hypothetical protein